MATRTRKIWHKQNEIHARVSPWPWSEFEKNGDQTIRTQRRCSNRYQTVLQRVSWICFTKNGHQFIFSNEITQMTSMKDAEVFYRERDTEIKTVVERLEVVTKTFGGHTLFDPQEIISANEDEVIFTNFIWVFDFCLSDSSQSLWILRSHEKSGWSVGRNSSNYLWHVQRSPLPYRRWSRAAFRHSNLGRFRIWRIHNPISMDWRRISRTQAPWRENGRWESYEIAKRVSDLLIVSNLSIPWYNCAEGKFHNSKTHKMMITHL